MSEEQHFVRGLGLLDATMIVAGSMIGSGIFIVSADIAREVGSPGWLLVVWLITGCLTLAAALSYGELAAMMPKAGGQYVYLREAYGPLWGFLYGWTLFMVIQCGTIAAVSVAFAKFLGVLLPWVSADTKLLGPVSSQQAVAIAVILVLSATNMGGVRAGKLIQNTFTIAKLGALAALIALGLFAGHAAAPALTAPGFWTPAVGGWAIWTVVGTAMVGSLFSSDAWNNITFTAGEVRDPKRNIPLALALGTVIVTGLYMLANLAYLNALPLAAIQHAPQDRVGTAVALSVLGPAGSGLMAAAIMVSTFGCVNGLVLAGARVYYAMAQDGLFFKAAGKLNKQGVPAVGLALQAVWAAALTLSGSYGNLLDYVIFAALLLYVLTVGAIFVLRRTRPEAERPYKAVGYPLVPALYMVLASLLMLDLLIYKPGYTWPGLGIVLAGLPVYFIWRAKAG
ncbi:MAG: amino acid permease-associated region [Cyanobacteria bacterium RYN_339]|nr:amino acid permease-associated region [Cyanobacteria bacterium RYN_339]